MNKWYTKKGIVVFIFVAMQCMLNAQESNSTLQLKIGSKLFYTYKINEIVYPKSFVVEITNLEPFVSFKWTLSKPILKSGNIVMSAKAVQNGHSFYHTFSGGTTELNNETALLLSKRSYRLLSKGKRKLTLAINYGKPKYESFYLADSLSDNKVDVSPNFIVTTNNQLYSVSQFVLKNASKSTTVAISKNLSLPLLLFLESDYTMYLAEIQL